MPPVIVGALERAKSTVKEFTLAQRTLVIIGVAVLVMGIVALYSWVGRPEMKKLFTGVSAKDASAITKQLETDGIAYEVDDDGTIKVDANKIYDARMSLAEKDLPSAPTEGYAILDNLGVVASDFQQQMASKRALEGELANTITSMENVDKASVMLAIPAETVFADHKNKMPTKASVTVNVRAGKELTTNQVEGIVKLVSSSIPNLDPVNVSVVDGTGKVLSDSVNGGSAAATEYEKRVQAAVEAIVNPLVGPENAVVSVTAKLSDKSIDRHSITYTIPEGGSLPLSESKSMEDYKGKGTIVGGVLGPDNIGNPYNLENSGTGGTYNTEQGTRNNSMNSVEERTTVTPGTAVENQSVSVVVNQAAARKIERNALRDAVIAASGSNLERGDIVNVSVMPFDETAAKAREAAAKEAEAQALAAKRADMIRQAVIAGIIGLLLLIIMIIAKRRAKKREREALDLGELDQMPEPVTLTPPGEEEEPLAIEPPEPEPEPEPPQPDPVILALEAKRQEIADMAMDKPGLLAEQLRIWMKR